MKLKKTLIFCILIFSIIFISEASAEIKDVLEDDGTDWTNPNLTDSWRLAYVNGFIAGVSVVGNRFCVVGDSIKSEVDKAFYNKTLNEIDLSGITIGQIMEGIDAFYNDFSNRRIKIVDSIYVVKMQIKGEDPELIDSQIRYLKMQPIDLEISKKCWKKFIAFCEKKGSKAKYKEIKNGDFSLEDLLRTGIFIDANNNLHDLFCYGVYK